MAKKKKKKASSIIAAHQPQPQQSSSPTHSPKVQQDQVGESSVPEAEDFIVLKLKRASAVNSKSAGGSSVKNELPTLVLAEQDADKIDARRNDDVLVFVKEKDMDKPESLIGVLICRVGIVASPSARSPSSATKRQALLPFGTCQVQPSHLVEGLFQSTQKDSNNDTDTNSIVTDNATQSSSSVVLQTPSPSKPQQTPSKSGFSFAVGGGGDSLISPLPATPPSYSTPKVKQKSQGNRKDSTVWITRTSSPVGQDAQSILCQDAQDIHITIQEDASTALTPSRLSSYKRVLGQLFLAHCSGRYVHTTDAISISFQGKPLALEIHVVESERAVTARNQQLLELEMEALEIQDDYPDREDNEGDMESQLWKLLRKQLDAPTSEATQKLLLYKITKETRLTFSCHDGNECDNKPSSNITEAVKQSNSSPVPKVVAGLSPTLTRLRSLLLAPLLKPELFIGGSLKAPRGVLLHGSPGVGKSSLANQLALDLAREYPGRLRVEPVNCATLQSYSSQVGEAEKMLCSIFERASLPTSTTTNTDKATVGTLLIFDDIQLICKKRSGYNAGSDRLAATLLGLLDGIGSSTSAGKQTSAKGAISNSIVILAITSDPSVLDPALRRPGRLDFELEVPAPDEPATRAEIIGFHLKDLGKDYDIPQFSEKELLSLGELAKGFNGADCMLSVKEALRIAIFKQQQLEGEAITGKTDQHELTLTDLKTAIRATKPSAIKSVTVEIPTVLWSSIGGMERVKRELREAIELPMTHAHLFDQLGIPPPRGILLYGPPGCSKTLMARALATEGKMNFLAVKGPELLSKWLGESERALASLFRRARMASPSIVFFDEVDAIAATRGSGGIGTGGGRLLSQLLTELDGVNQTGGVTLGTKDKKPPRVVVVAATNRPDLIDSALMRPGRIDRKILVGVPDLKSRARIFEIGLKDRACSDCIDVAKLSEEEVSGGFSGAELIAVCKDAALLALEEDDACPNTSSELPSIKMRHLLKAIRGMQRQITPEMIDFYESFKRGESR